MILQMKTQIEPLKKQLTVLIEQANGREKIIHEKNLQQAKLKEGEQKLSDEINNLRV